MADDFQYVKLPDGSYGKFAANASNDDIRAAVTKDFPNAYQQNLKTGEGMLPGAGGPVAPGSGGVPSKVKMKESVASKAVRAATSTLPAVGAMAGGLLTSPGVVTTAAGAGLGAMAGKQGELLANHAIFGPDETSPISKKGLIDTGVEGAMYAVPTAAADVGTRVLLDQPIETGFGIAKPYVGAAITPENLAAQRAATREQEENVASFMNKGYKPVPEEFTPQGPTRVNKADIDPASLPDYYAPQGPTRLNPEDLPTVGGGKVVTPSEANPRFTGSEGRAATWTNDQVIKLAKQGNREAIAQVTRRGLDMPENVRYVAGDADYPRAVYNPRNVTRFTPSGEPIRQAAGKPRIVISGNGASVRRIEPMELPEVGNR